MPSFGPPAYAAGSRGEIGCGATAGRSPPDTWSRSRSSNRAGVAVCGVFAVEDLDKCLLSRVGSLRRQRLVRLMAGRAARA